MFDTDKRAGAQSPDYISRDQVQSDNHRAHDQASRERDALGVDVANSDHIPRNGGPAADAAIAEALGVDLPCDCEAPRNCDCDPALARVHVTNTPRAGETPHSRDRTSHERKLRGRSVLEELKESITEAQAADEPASLIETAAELRNLAMIGNWPVPIENRFIGMAERLEQYAELEHFREGLAKMHSVVISAEDCERLRKEGLPQRLEPGEVAAAFAEGSKDGNPKDAIGITKTPFSTVSAPVLSELGLAMLEGALKYGRHNYRFAGVRASVYYDAVFRHMTRWFEGEDIDPDTIVRDDVTGEVIFEGISHLVKAMAGLAVIRDAMIQDKFIDDRPPQSPTGWQDEINAGVVAFNKKYPEPVAPYLSDGRRGPGRTN